MILMVHDNKDHGMIALSEGVVAGEHTPARRYHHEGKFVAVEAKPHTRDHDVAELKRLGYRFATPEEQNEYASTKRKTGALRERGR